MCPCERARCLLRAEAAARTFDLCLPLAVFSLSRAISHSVSFCVYPSMLHSSSHSPSLLLHLSRPLSLSLSCPHSLLSTRTFSHFFLSRTHLLSLSISLLMSLSFLFLFPLSLSFCSFSLCKARACASSCACTRCLLQARNDTRAAAQPLTACGTGQVEFVASPAPAARSPSAGAHGGSSSLCSRAGGAACASGSDGGAAAQVRLGLIVRRQRGWCSRHFWVCWWGGSPPCTQPRLLLHPLPRAANEKRTTPQGCSPRPARRCDHEQTGRR